MLLFLCVTKESQLSDVWQLFLLGKACIIFGDGKGMRRKTISVSAFLPSKTSNETEQWRSRDASITCSYCIQGAFGPTLDGLNLDRPCDFRQKYCRYEPIISIKTCVAATSSSLLAEDVSWILRERTALSLLGKNPCINKKAYV